MRVMLVIGQCNRTVKGTVDTWRHLRHVVSHFAELTGFFVDVVF